MMTRSNEPDYRYCPFFFDASVRRGWFFRAEPGANPCRVSLDRPGELHTASVMRERIEASDRFNANKCPSAMIVPFFWPAGGLSGVGAALAGFGLVLFGLTTPQQGMGGLA